MWRGDREKIGDEGVNEDDIGDEDVIDPGEDEIGDKDVIEDKIGDEDVIQPVEDEIVDKDVIDQICVLTFMCV